MKKLIFILAVVLLVMTANSCTPKFDAEDTDNIYAQIVLSDNRKINLRLDYDSAPKTVTNFIELVQKGYYKNTIFHRVIDDFMIQGGGYTMSNGNVKEKSGAKEIYGEFSSNGWKKNKIKHVTGVISMARRGNNNNSASSEFFICAAVCSHLDGDYAAFGKTTDTDSKKVVLDISSQKTYEYSAAFTDMPVKVVKIRTINLSNSKF